MEMSDALPTVILTVPHAGCPPVPAGVRVCDVVAEAFANAVAQAVLDTHPDKDFAEVRAARALRTYDLDMNRVNSRYSHFRRALRERAVAVLLRRGNAGMFVLDVHSFPGTWSRTVRTRWCSSTTRQSRARTRTLCTLTSRAAAQTSS